MSEDQRMTEAKLPRSPRDNRPLTCPTSRYNFRQYILIENPWMRASYHLPEWQSNANNLSLSIICQLQLATALDDLRDKYRRLQQLRETDAEQNLAECRRQLDETIRSAENYRAKIEPQLECKLSYFSLLYLHHHCL